MTRRHPIEAGLIVALVIVALVIAAVRVSGPQHVQGPDMSEACGPSERFVVESNYIGCTRDGKVPSTEGAGVATYGIDDRRGHEVY